MIDSKLYIGKILDVKIDRPMGSKHPKHGFIYPVNYGYVPNTISGDGEELDCYVLGIFEPVDTFRGKCIAIIHRIDDNDDKLITVPEEKEYPDGIEEKILGGHYIMSGNSLIDLNTDKIVLQLNKNEDNNTRDYVISIQDSIMLIDRTIDNRESREMIIPFEDEEALVRRVRQIVGQRILSPLERAQYRE